MHKRRILNLTIVRPAVTVASRDEFAKSESRGGVVISDETRLRVVGQYSLITEEYRSQFTGPMCQRSLRKGVPGIRWEAGTLKGSVGPDLVFLFVWMRWFFVRCVVIHSWEVLVFMVGTFDPNLDRFYRALFSQRAREPFSDLRI